MCFKENMVPIMGLGFSGVTNKFSYEGIKIGVPHKSKGDTLAFYLCILFSMCGCRWMILEGCHSLSTLFLSSCRKCRYLGKFRWGWSKLHDRSNYSIFGQIWAGCWLPKNPAIHWGDIDRGGSVEGSIKSELNRLFNHLTTKMVSE